MFRIKHFLFEFVFQEEGASREKIKIAINSVIDITLHAESKKKQLYRIKWYLNKGQMVCIPKSDSLKIHREDRRLTINGSPCTHARTRNTSVSKNAIITDDISSIVYRPLLHDVYQTHARVSSRGNVNFCSVRSTVMIIIIT